MPRALREVAMAPAPSAYPGTIGPFSSMFVPTGLDGAKVVGPWAIWFVLRQFQWILGPMRRCSGHWFVQFGAMAAYYLPIPVLFYAASAGNRLTSDDILWVNTFNLFLLLLSSWGTVVTTTCSLSDGPFQRWRFLPWLPYIVWLQADYIWRLQDLSRSFKVGWISTYAVLPLFLFFNPSLAAKQLDYQAKEFADFMTAESRSASPFFDVVDANSSLHNGCKYPFMQKKDREWVTIKDLLQCDQLPEYCTVDARDLCLSYSFCRLLERRYFGFHCAEEGNAEVRNFVLTELLPNYKRAFTIVEVQLAFLHDHFFTVYRSNIPFAFPSVKELMLVMILASVAGQVIGAILTLVCGLKFEVYLYVLSVIQYPVFVLIILPKMCPVLPKYWGPIWYASINYPTATGRASCPSFIARYIHWSLSWNWSQKSYWRNEIGQYSLIEDYDRCTFMKSIAAWIKGALLSEVSHSFIKHRPVKEGNVRVPDSVRKSVALVLQGMRESVALVPTNGSWCLKKNTDIEFDVFAWTLRQETHTHTVLIWHIATCYCDMYPLVETTASEHDFLQNNHEVATALSRYCAYLVAFHPEFLPEHSLSTMVVLQQVLKEAKDLLGGTRISMEEKRRNIRELRLPENDDSLNTFENGVKLGQKLAQLSTSVQWKVMAEFWAETVLYVAPSDNAAAHVERLAKGGEFVTHLWAMLSNAGILKRATEDQWSPPQQHEPTVSDSVISLEDRQGRRNSVSDIVFFF